MRDSPRRRGLVLIGLTLLVVLSLAACKQTPPTTVEVTREVTVQVPGPEVEVTRIVEVTLEPVVAVVPFEADWSGSAHNAKTDEPFVHWNEDDPAEIPTSCAKCHSNPGYLDFIGADGSPAGVVDKAAPIGTTVTCETCHNSVTLTMSSVTFPSGIEVTGLGPESRCMQCHQGRESMMSVGQKITDAALPDDDTVSADLGFTNIHYYAAAATLYGTVAKGGFEYEGKTYDAKFDHVPGIGTCVGCHNQHTLKLRLEKCGECHDGVASYDDLKNIRMNGSLQDFDGDGDTEEGIYYELEGVRAVLLQAIQTYANEVSGVAIAYSPDAYPYFFLDTNSNGTADTDEAVRANGYNAWTGRLTKAAYNYQVSLKDPGAFAHGGKYILELMYDSIESLNAKLTTPIDMANLHRIDFGHFAGSELPFRDWDDTGVVPGSCSKCHSATGMPFFLKEGVTASQPTANGLNCATCHNDLKEFTIYEVKQVTFPSGAVLVSSNDDLKSNLCITCHQGRESTTSVNRLIGTIGDDEVSDKLRFLNIHYFAAGATLFGTEAKGAYEYAGQTYLGRNEHVGAFNSCVECHNIHSQEVVVEECADCHENVKSKEDLPNIRNTDDPTVDYDGDGDSTEGIANEIATMRDAVYVALQAYAKDKVGTPIVYSVSSYPYFFTDANDNGVVDGDEAATRYATWSPRLLRAAYNYQYSQKDPGAFAHNGKYVVQILYDTLNDLGGNVSTMTRP